MPHKGHLGLETQLSKAGLICWIQTQKATNRLENESQTDLATPGSDTDQEDHLED